MASVNRVTLLGHLGQDPESRTFTSGDEVVNLSVATSESWKDKDGNKQEKTEWHRVSILNQGLCRVAKQYLRKGSKVYLEGQLQTRKWKDQNGQDRYSTEVTLRPYHGELVLLDRREGGGRGGGSYGRDDYGGGQGGGMSGNRPSPAFDTDLDDDVPF